MDAPIRLRWLGPLLVLGACDSASEPEVSDPWPSVEVCEEFQAWPSNWVSLERDAIALVDDVRAEGADCQQSGKRPPVGALTRRSALDCAARLHAQDMVEREYFGRLDPDGVDERARVDSTGYAAQQVVQHIAAGPRDAEELVERTWLPRAVPCSSMMSSTLTEIGLAHVGDVDDEYGTYWVMVLAQPQ